MDTTEPAHLDDADGPLLAAPARDGRTGYADLPAATGWSESRRSGGAWSTGAVYFDVDVEPGPVGYPVRVMLCLSVAPAHLAAVGEAMALQPEVVFAAATTGTTNLVATVIRRDMAGLYTYLTERIGPLPGVERVESSPTVRHLKRVAAVP